MNGYLSREVLDMFIFKSHSSQLRSATPSVIRKRADEQTPLTIDSFELLKVIGKGSFGKVSPSPHACQLTIRSCKSVNATHSESMPSKPSEKPTSSLDLKSPIP
jgi:hypothetical protein